MKKRKILFDVVIVVVIVFAAIILALKTNKIFEKKASRNDYYDFIHSSLNSDILFIGTSHMARAVNPMELWDMNGYTSYVLTAAGDGVKRDVAILEIALDYTRPKLVVLDTDQYWLADELNHQVKNYHRFSDSFPLSGTKIKTTLELYEDSSVRTELLFPWLVYHNRWDELERPDFYSVSDSRCFKGYDYEANIVKANLPKDPLKKDNMADLGGEGLKEIEKFIQKCKVENIEVLLVTLPYSANNEQRLYAVKLSEVASKYRVNYINFNEKEFFVDEKTDFSDLSHMNVSGAKKMTEFLGTYISENYDVPDRRTEKEYSDKWNEDCVAYCEMIKQKMIEETELKNILLMCNDKAFTTSLYMDDTLHGQGTDLIRKLIKENPTAHTIDKDTALSMVAEDERNLLEQKDAYIWVYDAVTGDTICEKSFEAIDTFMAEAAKGTEEEE